MSLRRRSVLVRITLLVLVPLVFLIGIFSYAITSSASATLVLIRAKVVISDLNQPVASLQHALSRERTQMIVYFTRPSPAAYAALLRQQAVTDHAIASFTAAAESSPVRRDASTGAARAIAGLRAGLAGLPRLRAKITDQSISGQQALAAYNGLIAASYQILEQSIIAEGNARQVLPAIAVIELAISDEYLQQESALLNAGFAAHAFPARDQRAFVSLVGAHRLLYGQSYSYLNPADRASLDRDVNPRVAHTLARLEEHARRQSRHPERRRPRCSARDLERDRRHAQQPDRPGGRAGRGPLDPAVAPGARQASGRSTSTAAWAWRR